MLASYFKLSEHGTNLRTEVIAGTTTFLAMAYIIFVNPDILASPIGSAVSGHTVAFQGPSTV